MLHCHPPHRATDSGRRSARHKQQQKKKINYGEGEDDDVCLLRPSKTVCSMTSFVLHFFSSLCFILSVWRALHLSLSHDHPDEPLQPPLASLLFSSLLFSSLCLSPRSPPSFVCISAVIFLSPPSRYFQNPLCKAGSSSLFTFILINHNNLSVFLGNWLNLHVRSGLLHSQRKTSSRRSK